MVLSECSNAYISWPWKDDTAGGVRAGHTLWGEDADNGGPVTISYTLLLFIPHINTHLLLSTLKEEGIFTMDERDIFISFFMFFFFTEVNFFSSDEAENNAD